MFAIVVLMILCTAGIIYIAPGFGGAIYTGFHPSFWGHAGGAGVYGIWRWVDSFLPLGDDDQCARPTKSWTGITPELSDHFFHDSGVYLCHFRPLSEQI
jgi:hypothetical protein